MPLQKVKQKQSFPEMESVFDAWNEEKKQLEISDHSEKIKFKEWEIWWISMGRNIWAEALGKWESFRRPILIIRKLSSHTCIWIPLSSKDKKWTWFCDIEINNIKRTALLYQIKMVDTKRFQRRIWVIPETDFKTIKKRLKELLNL